MTDIGDLVDFMGVSKICGLVFSFGAPNTQGQLFSLGLTRPRDWLPSLGNDAGVQGFGWGKRHGVATGLD